MIICIHHPGEKLCERVHDSLRDHYSKLGIPFEEDDERSSQSASQVVPKSSKSKPIKATDQQVDGESDQMSSQPKKKPSKPRSYVPQPRSGSFAILVALIRAERNGVLKMTKAQVIQDAQEFCNESMSKATNGSFYSGFSSMKTLVKKELVAEERRRMSEYCLTDEGRKLAEKLLIYVNGAEIKPVQKAEEEESSTSSSQSSAIDFQMADFDIVLLVDTRESTSGVDSSIKKTSLMANLTQQLSVPVEMRALPAGDFAWIARERPTSNGKVTSSQVKKLDLSNSQSSTVPAHFSAVKNGNHITTSRMRRELMLDYVVERKRVDDLASSIADGRFLEQKHRLKSSGIRKPIYLVESLTKGDYKVPYRNLLLAVHNSQVIDGFNVKYTKDHSETISYLIIMTKSLIKKYSRQTLYSCTKEELPTKDDNYLMTYSDYESGSKKMTNFTVSEMFLKQLLSFSGMSVGKAKSIVDRYPTVGSLIEAYEGCTEEGKKGLKERINLIATIKESFGERCIGPVLGKKLMLTYCRDADNYTESK